MWWYTCSRGTRKYLQAGRQAAHGSHTGQAAHGTHTGQAAHGSHTGKAAHGAYTGQAAHGAYTAKEAPLLAQAAPLRHPGARRQTTSTLHCLLVHSWLEAPSTIPTQIGMFMASFGQFHSKLYTVAAPCPSLSDMGHSCCPMSLNEGHGTATVLQAAVTQLLSHVLHLHILDKYNIMALKPHDAMSCHGQAAAICTPSRATHGPWGACTSHG